MKICCSSSISDIEDFIGTDIWVKMNSYDYYSDYYVKIDSIYPAHWDNTVTMIKYYCIKSRLIDDALNDRVTIQYIDSLQYEYDYSGRFMSDDVGINYFCDKWSVLNPVEVISDEELEAILSEAFKRFL